jgi:hypothetical protein
MLSLKVETVMSIVSIFFCTLKQACYLENIIVKSDFGFIDYLVINNVNFDIIPTK